MPELVGRRALVTGGGRGIGRAVALDLAHAGASVAVAARTSAEVEAVAGEIRAKGGHAVALTGDVTRPESVRHLFAAGREALGGIDILVTGAGIAPTAPLVKTPDSLWRDVLETNLSGVFYCLREGLPGMTARGWGRVVNVASIAGRTGYPYIAAYAASKHGVLGLTKCAAVEVATSGVTVNAVCPGYVDTPMLDAGVATIVDKTGLTREEARRRLAEASPQKRLFTTAEVSALVLFLCTDAARGINGQALTLDGGTVL
jgi:NAD(P)-dependent dehydrogenase (short-subunit alcohol dehydrogenase family)